VRPEVDSGAPPEPPRRENEDPTDWLDRFPRWRVFWRIEREMGTALTGRWSVALAIALLSSLVSAVVERTSQGRVSGPPPAWGAVIVRAAGTGVVVYVGVGAMIFCASLLRYYVRQDRIWKLELLGTTERVVIGLICQVDDPPVALETLARVDGAVKLPLGRVVNVKHWMMRSREWPTGLQFWLIESPPAAGKYRVRAYGETPQRRRYEIARATFIVGSDPRKASPLCRQSRGMGHGAPNRLRSARRRQVPRRFGSPDLHRVSPVEAGDIPGLADRSMATARPAQPPRLVDG
jgi:hypothetical protein